MDVAINDGEQGRAGIAQYNQTIDEHIVGKDAAPEQGTTLEAFPPHGEVALPGGRRDDSLT
jgi:hypothetical protein